jgi:hypothetical protein
MIAAVLVLTAVLSVPPATAAIPYLSGIPDRSLQCEFLLSDPSKAENSIRWIADALSPLTQSAPAHLAYSPTAAALKALGLPEELPQETRLKIEGPVSNVYWVIVLSGVLEITRFPFHIPPVYVWKRVAEAKDLENIELFYDLSKENQYALSAGTLTGQFLHGRKFVSVRRVKEYVAVSIGLDVEVDFHEHYSNSSLYQIMTMTNRDDFYSRIEVLRANFPVSGKPAAHRQGSRGNIN